MVKKLIFLGLLLSNIAFADDVSFQHDKERGWFWREEHPVLIEEEFEDQEPPKTAKEEAATPKIKPFSSQWLRENIPKLRDAAIDEPSKDNVSAFYYAQRVAMDKSERFADVAMQVVESDPFLDANAKSPISNAGKDMLAKEVSQATDSVMNSISAKSGIWFFFRSDCNYCHSQAKILKAFQNRYNIKVMAISMDGGPLSDDFPDYKVDSGQAASMGVTVSPTLLLSTPPNGLSMLGEGFLPLDELSKRIIHQSVATGAITQQQQDSTRQTKKNLVPSDIGKDLMNVNLENPQELKKYVLNAMKANQK